VYDDASRTGFINRSARKHQQIRAVSSLKHAILM